MVRWRLCRPRTQSFLSRFRLLISRGLFQSETCLSASVTAAFLCVTYPRIFGSCPSLPVTVTDFGMLTAWLFVARGLTAEHASSSLPPVRSQLREPDPTAEVPV